MVRIGLPEKNDAALRARMEGDEMDPPAEVAALISKLRKHLAGKAQSFASVVLDLRGRTPFVRDVYVALQATRAGETLSYGQLAARVGVPGAARAVGRAMAHNPIPVVVPCHRVLAAGGKPGGFSAYGGAVTKARLLELEGVHLGVAGFDHSAAVRALRRADPKLGKMIDRVGRERRLRLRPTRSTFLALSEAIVYQQLSGKAAATIYGRLIASFPKRPGMTPAVILAASDATLRAAGLSASKAAALKDLADKTLQGEVPTLRRLSRMEDEVIVETLTRVRGIGRWTAEMLLMFRLGRPDVLPVDDLGVRKGFALIHGLSDMPTPKELAALGECWRPWRSVGSWYCWRALEVG